MQASAENKLIALITPLIAPMGYEVVHVEIQSQRQKILRLFIDFTEEPKPDKDGEIARIGIEDCVRVTRALDEPLDGSSEVEGIFHGPYELEVSSPGVDRPLRQKKDFERFAGKTIRLHTFRALSEDEIGDGTYLARNPRQKNFIGVLKGLSGDRVLLAVEETGGAVGSKRKGAAKAAASDGNGATEITIPLPLISKANLEPEFDLEVK